MMSDPTVRVPVAMLEGAESLMEAALRYADLGLAVFPLAPEGKIPLVSRADGGRGCLDATTDMLTIARFWRDHPRANIGIATGPASRVFVLDVDAHEPKGGGMTGPAALAELERRHGALPPTLTGGTGGGGEHRYFRWPAGRELRNRARIKIDGVATALDSRAEGGYVAAPPSVHPNGAVYRWAPGVTEIAEAPGWLLDLLCPSRATASGPELARPYIPPAVGGTGDARHVAYGRSALDGACSDILAASEGQRHDVIRNKALWIFRCVAGGLLGHAEAEAALLTAGEATGKDPREVARAVEWGREKGLAEPYVPQDREMAPRVIRGPSAWDQGPPPGMYDDEPPPDDGWEAPYAGPAPDVGGMDARTAAVELARETIRRALAVLGAEQTTRAERATVGLALVEHVPALAWLSVLHPAEWATAVAGLAVAGGFATQAGRVDKAVREAATPLRGAVKEERRAAAEAKVEATGGPDLAAGPNWAVRGTLAVTEKGAVKGIYANLITILRKDPRWSTLRMSALGDVVELHGKEFREGPGTADAAEWMRDHYGIDAGEVSLKSAIYATAQGRAYSPVTDYLDSIRGKGDGGHAIARILPEVLGICNASDMHRAMVARFLIGAVARAYRPGCQMDTALVLAGPQGAMKSSFFRALFGEWFGDSPIPIGDKDAAIQLSRVWGYEAAELEDLTSKRTVDAVKAFMTTRKDLFRPPFARTAVLNARHTVLCGSINPKGGFLTDETGSRRFWILTIPPAWVINLPLIAALRDAVWAEALEAFEGGDRWHFDRAEDVVREEDSQQYVEEDPWQAAIAEWVRTPTAMMQNFKTAQVLEAALKLEAAQRTRAHAGRVRAILVRLGWKEHASPTGFRGERVWRRGEG